MTISNNPWDPQREPCCGSHVLGLSCCDLNDCGPCCENCPTCPTLAARRARRIALAQARAAVTIEKYENPMNGDGHNYALDKVYVEFGVLMNKGEVDAYHHLRRRSEVKSGDHSTRMETLVHESQAGLRERRLT